MTATATPEPESALTPENEPTRTPKPESALTRVGLPRWLVLTLMSGFLLLIAGIEWAIASAQTGCGFLDMPATGILPGPQPCAPDATTPALVTIWLVALLVAAAFVAAFTVERRRGAVLLILAGAMLAVAVIGTIATVVATATVPPIIYY